MSKTGRALVQGAVGQVLSMAVAMAAQIATVPIIVHGLGDRLFGAWTLVSVMVGYQGLLELGLSTAVSRFVSQAIGRGDRHEADGIVTTALFMSLIGAVFSLALAAIAALLCRILVTDSADAALFSNLSLIMGASVAVSFPARSLRGVLQGYLRYDLLSLVEMFCGLARAILSVLAIWLGGKVLTMSIAVSAVMIPYTLSLFIIARRTHGPVKWDRALFTVRRAVAMLRFGIVTFVGQVADMLRLQIYAPMISGYLGMAAVTPYGIADRLVCTFSRVGIAVLGATSTVFSGQEGRGDIDSLRWSYFFTYRLACYLGVYLAGMTAILGPDFVLRWMGPEHADAIAILLILLVAHFLDFLQIPTIYFMYGTSRHRSFAIANVVDGVANVAFSLLLIRSHGLAGMALGTAAAAFVARCVLMPWSISRILGVSLFQYHFRHTLPGIVKPGVFMVILYLICRKLLVPDYRVLVGVGLVASMAFALYIYVVGFNRRERSLFTVVVLRKKTGPKP